MNNAHGGMGPPLSQLMGPFDRGTAGQNTRRNNALLKSNKKKHFSKTVGKSSMDLMDLDAEPPPQPPPDKIVYEHKKVT
jgi:hypothetical protein